MDDNDKSTLITFFSTFCVMVSVFATLRYLAYVGSPEDLYFGTLNRVMDCRRTKTASPEILDQICGKIPNISDYVKETK